MKKLLIVIFLFFSASSTANAESDFGFQGNEFDSTVMAYSVTTKDNTEFQNFLYSLVVGKTIASGAIFYRVDVSVFYKGDWRRYETATKKGGVKLEVASTNKKVVTCAGSGKCVLMETITILLSKEEFLSGIEFQISGGGHRFIFDIPEEEATKVQKIADENFPNF